MLVGVGVFWCMIRCGGVQWRVVVFDLRVVVCGGVWWCVVWCCGVLWCIVVSVCVVACGSVWWSIVMCDGVACVVVWKCHTRWWGLHY